MKLTSLIEQALIVMRAEAVQGGVATSAIIECFDIKEKVGSSLVAGVIDAVMHELASQRAEETPHRSDGHPHFDQ